MVKSPVPFLHPIQYIFGKDVFIAYGRGDGIRYAAALAEELSAQGLRVALDQWGCQPDEEIPWRLRLSLRLAQCLVVVGSDLAGKSAHVAQEVENFPKRTRPVIPISFSGSIERAIWFAQIRGVPVESQTAVDLERGQPSAECVKRILNSVRFNRQATRVRRAFTFGSFLLLALIAIAVYLNRKSDAEGEARVAARALELVALSRAQTDRNPDLAMSLANQSLDLKDTAEGASALRAALAANLTEFTWVHPTGKISELSFSADGKYVVTTGTDRTARMWDTATGLQFLQIGPLQDAGEPTLSANGEFLTISGGKTEVWSTHTRKSLWSFTGRAVRNATAVPGQFAIVDNVTRAGESEKTRYELHYEMRDIRDGKLVRKIGIEPDEKLVGVVLSYTGRWLAVGRDENITVWDIGTGAKAQFAHKGEYGGLYKVFFSQDDQFVGGTYGFGQTVLWKLDLAETEPWLVAADHDANPLAVTVTKGKQLLVTVGQNYGKANTYEVLDRGKILPQKTIINDAGSLLNAALSSDGLYAVTSGFADNAARIWALNAPRGGPLRQRLVGHTGPIKHLDFSPDDSRVASVSDDGSARLWRRSPIVRIKTCPRANGGISVVGPEPLTPDWANGAIDEIEKQWLETTQRFGCESATRGDKGAVELLAFSPRWPNLVASSGIGVSVGKAGQSELVPIRAGPEGGYRFAKWAPDGAAVLSAGKQDTAIELWNPLNGARTMVLKVSEHEHVRDAAINKDGSRILAYALEDSVRLWDRHGVEVSAPLKHDRIVKHAAFSPDGSRIITTDLGGSVTLWSATDGKKLKGIKLPIGSASVSVAKVGENGKLIIVGVEHGRMYALDTTTLDTIQVFEDDRVAVEDVALSPDGQILLSIDEFARVRIWDVVTGKTLTEIVDSLDTLLVPRLSISPFAGYFAVSTRFDTKLYRCDFCGPIATVRSAARSRLQGGKSKAQEGLVLPVPTAREQRGLFK